MALSRRRLLVTATGLLLAAAATTALWMQDSRRERVARASAQRILLETEGRQLWQASVLLAREQDEGYDDLQTLVLAQYVTPEVAARFRHGAGVVRFISRASMPEVPAGSLWGGPDEYTEVSRPAAHLAVHHDGSLEWVPAERFAGEYGDRP